MNTKSITTLSTVHIHPLEVERLNEDSLLRNKFTNLFPLDNDVLGECKRLNLVCLVEVLTELKEKYNADYVMFDADEPAIDEFKKYDCYCKEMVN